jgi:hypothetical protein
MKNNLITVVLDDAEVRILCHERIAMLIKEVDAEYVFWDTAELKKRTCLSWNTIQKAFFYDPGFPKRKVGGKWLFPTRESRMFLERWIMEQPKG